VLLGNNLADRNQLRYPISPSLPSYTAQIATRKEAAGIRAYRGSEAGRGAHCRATCSDQVQSRSRAKLANAETGFHVEICGKRHLRKAAGTSERDRVTMGVTIL
jgi:hypothetical protein